MNVSTRLCLSSCPHTHTHTHLLTFVLYLTFSMFLTHYFIYLYLFDLTQIQCLQPQCVYNTQADVCVCVCETVYHEAPVYIVRLLLYIFNY